MTLKGYFEMDASHQAAFRLGQQFSEAMLSVHPGSESGGYSPLEMSRDIVGSLKAFWDDFAESFEVSEFPPIQAVKDYNGNLYMIQVTRPSTGEVPNAGT